MVGSPQILTVVIGRDTEQAGQATDLLKGLSRVMGNYHARFLGERVVAMPLVYPTLNE